MSSISFWIGIPCLVFLVRFVLFAFRQGMPVRNPPEVVPTDGGSGHGA